MIRRYRKGQIFRPPTAAESAVNADALEAFRSRSAQPQDRAPLGQSILVKTPADGIAARSGTTIYSATCNICIETGDADQKTIVETDSGILVYNVYATGVAGDTYVVTDLMRDGTRYAELPGLQLVTVEKDGGVSGGAAANCTWTYTVKTLSDVTLETGITPQHARFPNTTYLEAGAGGRSEYAFAQYVAGTLILKSVEGEIQNTGVCVTP